MTSAKRALHQPGERHDAAPDHGHDQSGGEQCDQHRQRRGVGRGRERDQGDQRPALPACQRVAAQRHEIERQHRDAGENVSEQRAREPGQAGGDRQRRRGDEQDQRRRQRMGAQREPQHPHRQQRLHRHRRPEIRPRREHEIEAVDGRAAFLEMALVPAREIAAGVVLQQREAVPQRRREQHQRRGQGGGEAELHLGLGSRIDSRGQFNTSVPMRKGAQPISVILRCPPKAGLEGRTARAVHPSRLASLAPQRRR